MHQKYKLFDKIGEGSFGQIYKAVNEKTGKVMAIKKIKIKSLEEGLPKDFVREFESQKIIEHPNVLKLEDVYLDESTVHLVYEYMPCDLYYLFSKLCQPLTEAQVKSYFLMILRAIYHLHSKKIIHRDIKPSNILISSNNVLKLTDFGLAHALIKQNPKPMSTEIGTRWYKAPELLLGDKFYDNSIDIWAAGCILSELIENNIFFQGANDLEQLSRIIKTLGTLNEEKWPGVVSLPDYNKLSLPEIIPPDLHEILPHATDLELDLLTKMLVYDPSKRISALEALNHSLFYTKPYPTELSELPFILKENEEHKIEREPFSSSLFK